MADMAYRIRPDEKLPRAIRRMARAELAEARLAVASEQQPLGGRVHEARTALKKVRALTRLVQPAAGRQARRADRSLRKIARRLSGVRDAEVLLHTFDGLLAAAPGGDPAATTATASATAARSPSLEAARRRLAQRLERKARPFAGRRGEVRRLDGRLARERRRVGRWLPPVDRFRSVGTGFVDGYRRARHAMEDAYSADTGDAFHRWRRRVKAHRHHVAVLAPLALEEMEPRLEALDRLGQLLGDEHDLTLLEATIRTERSCFADPRDAAQVLVMIEERRRTLRARARILGRRLFAERPSELRRRAKILLRRFRNAEDQIGAHPSRARAALGSVP
jgi:CHAD domain-containing protein